MNVLAAAFRRVVVTMLVLTSMVLHAATAPGTALLNQAELRYFDPLTGQVVRVLSNTSRVMVGERLALELDEDKARLVSPGQTANIEHLLFNTGNVDDSYSLSLANMAGDAGDLQGLAVYLDINGNGLADAGEPAITELLQVAPGASVALVISGTTPASLQEGQEIRVSLHAVSQRDSAVVDAATDRVMVADGASLELSKSSSQSCDSPLAEGAQLEYRLSITNAGNTAPQERVIQLAGQPEQGVLIEDNLPGNVTLLAGAVSSVAPVQALPVVHFSGDARDVWQRYDSWNGTGNVEKIGLLIPASAIRNNQTGGFSFKVQVNTGLTQGTMLFNKAHVDLDGNGVIDGKDVESNRVCNQVAAALTPGITFQRPANHVYQQKPGAESRR